jgi:hypothetical protein
MLRLKQFNARVGLILTIQNKQLRNLQKNDTAMKIKLFSFLLLVLAAHVFTSCSNGKGTRELFKSDPKKYAPQYGGYCAYGMAEGHKAATQPDAWTIVNGKLYLNYSKEVKGLWMKDQQNLIDQADKNWDEVKKQ